eukprot:CAMPEP_0171916196 /NCGR_PEP_ID=MMETSP0993-20121228/14697_1 /TAXON_ID=483369 /ORGANISM="non described non described, Strain CCMP2098" /LENGTH=698 /DNA_ID=CAMNT_0012551545 /DNA_START=46 /DNA_END=2142 /DNA_ORIENTATION=+
MKPRQRLTAALIAILSPPSFALVPDSASVTRLTQRHSSPAPLNEQFEKRFDGFIAPMESQQGFLSWLPSGVAGAASWTPPSSGEVVVESKEESNDDVFAGALLAAQVFEASGPVAVIATVMSLAMGLSVVDDPWHAWALAESLFYLSCNAFAASVSATEINEQHPYDHQKRRDDWRRILSDPTRPSELALGWFFKNGGSSPSNEYNPLGILSAYAGKRLGWVSSACGGDDEEETRVRFGELSVGDVEHWVARSMFAVRSASELTPYHRRECLEMVREFESAAKRGLLQPSADRTPGVESLCAYVGDLRWKHRPLAFYALTHLVGGEVWTPYAMRSNGFERRTHKELVYWYKPGRGGKANTDVPPPTSSSSSSSSAVDVAAVEAMPLVFIHGIGVGPAPYLDLVNQAAGTQAPVVVVELACVSQRVCPTAPPPPAKFAELVDGALGELGISKAVVAGHSLGSAYVRYLSTSARGSMRKRVAGTVLIDPIACQLFHSQVTKEFVFPDVASVFQAADDYFIKKELFSAAVVQRQLPWFEANVWVDDASAAVPTLVIVSDDDTIVPGASVKGHFGSWQAALRGVRVLSLPGMGHGAWLADAPSLSRVAASIKGLRAEAAVISAATAKASEVGASLEAISEAAIEAANGAANGLALRYLEQQEQQEREQKEQEKTNEERGVRFVPWMFWVREASNNKRHRALV